MSALECKIEYDTVPDNTDKDSIPVIIVAAGSASRMNGIDKIFFPLCGVPLIVHTMRAFENCRYISNIIIVAKETDVLKLQQLTEKYNITKVTDIVKGGENRQESVKNGFSRLKKDAKNVLIHDGARPIVSQEVIIGVYKALKEHKCVTCAVRVKDTVKRLDESGYVFETLNRNELVCVQTPQGVCVEEYLSAINNADISLFTDDTSIMESVGIKTYITMGDYRNIKVTTREDLVVAEQYLREGQE